jgi:hypothetical protein
VSQPEAVLERRLLEMVRGDAWLMQVLQAAASLRQPQWCVAAGAVRNLVWDHLHGHVERTLPNDVDYLFHDTVNTAAAYEQALQSRLNKRLPGVTWDAVNQATIHVHNRELQPYKSIAQAMRRWPEPVTAVGVSLDDAGAMQVIAPFGLSDLFDMVSRPVPEAPGTVEVYVQRMAEKNWPARWPRVKVLMP